MGEATLRWKVSNAHIKLLCNDYVDPMSQELGTCKQFDERIFQIDNHL